MSWGLFFVFFDVFSSWDDGTAECVDQKTQVAFRKWTVVSKEKTFFFNTVSKICGFLYFPGKEGKGDTNRGIGVFFFLGEK